MSWRLVVVFVVCVALTPRLAMAEAGGGNACSKLIQADHNAQPFDDQVYTSTIQYLENGKTVKTFRLRVTTKGMHKMLISFLAPGDVRGMRILIVDPETMYSYLPQFRRVRRIAANARNQGFMGTNITNEDMSEHRYSTRWNCVGSKTTSSAWILDLAPKKGITTAYSKLRVTIGRKRVQYEQIDFYQGSRDIKTQYFEDWRTMEGLEMAGTVRYVSHDRNAEARIHFDEWHVNTGVPDDAFTRRALLRGD